MKNQTAKLNERLRYLSENASDNSFSTLREDMNPIHGENIRTTTKNDDTNVSIT